MTTAIGVIIAASILALAIGYAATRLSDAIAYFADSLRRGEE